jgi:hypothetical protein
LSCALAIAFAGGPGLRKTRTTPPILEGPVSFDIGYELRAGIQADVLESSLDVAQKRSALNLVMLLWGANKIPPPRSFFEKSRL